MPASSRKYAVDRRDLAHGEANAVAPGIVYTDVNAGWLRSNPAAAAQAARYSVFDRVGQPADIADVVAFVVSDEARWVTGQYLDATGGSLLGV